MLKQLIYVNKAFENTWRMHSFQGISLLTQYFALTFLAKYISYSHVECPICGWEGNNFRPVLVMPLWVRSKAQCPSCLSLERHRGLALFYKAWLKSSLKYGLFLHYAAEDCLKPIFHTIESIEYRSIYFTLEPMPIATAATGSKVVQKTLGYRHNRQVPIVGDLQAIEADDETVACLISHHVLEHVYDDRLALREIYRVLKPGGVCFLNVPMRPVGQTTLYYEQANSAGHWREYGDDLAQSCQEAGFTVKLHFLSEDSNLSKRYGLDKSDRLYELVK